MRWSEIEFDKNLWRIGAERTKNGLLHEVPLPKEVAKVLKAMPELGDKTATEVIADFTRDAPVDVYALARALGLEIKDIMLDEYVSGKIEKNWFADTYTISINSRHPVTRRRFTAAHEIAHFVLHWDIIGDGMVDDALYRSTKSDEIERQANAYAATILMPAPLVIAAFRNGEKSYAGIADIFKVSSEVARIRMRELQLA